MRAALLSLSSVCLASIALATQPVELARGVAPDHPQQPQVVVDANGAIHVVFGVGDVIRYCRSEDGGKTFTTPAHLPAVRNMPLGMRRGPRIAIANAAICVTAIGGQQGKGRDGDVLALHTIDGGKSWSGPVQVNDAADSAREGLHAMAAGSKGQLCCAWLDLRNKRTEIMAATSADGGQSWSNNVLVYRSPEKSVCECCHPSVAFDSAGGIFVLWRNSLAGARDMYVAYSDDSGRTFSTAKKLGQGSWPLKACPMDGGAIAATSPGKAAAAWRREKSIFLSLPGQEEERLLGPGEQPWIAASTSGTYVVWVIKRGETAQLLTPDSAAPVELAANAADPVVAAGPNGNGPVAVVWESRQGKNYAIECQVVNGRK